MSSRTVLIDTDPDGNFTYQRPLFGLILAAKLEVGDLDLGSLEVTVRDATRDMDLHAFGMLAGDDYWQPVQPDPVYGTLEVVVVNGGDTKHGKLRLLTEI